MGPRVTRSPLSSHIGCGLLRRTLQAGAQPLDSGCLDRCPEGPVEAVAACRFLQAGGGPTAEPGSPARSGPVGLELATGQTDHPEQGVHRSGGATPDAGPCRRYAPAS